ncbi:MAG: D-glycero-beta-D-manno-heptose-7-phosphate kinase [Syntrophobacterales bacterium]|nr:D-glycero-beta-D-manno-heptose-7-phosphate kinase [Syntrophobacterales bacterium]
MTTEAFTDPLRRLDLTRFGEVSLLVAGDFMLDEYIWGRVGRISPEAPVVVVRVERETRTLGGAGNVVHNLAALGARVEVLGLTGRDRPGELLRQELAALGVAPEGLFADPGRQTTRKTRVVGEQQQVVRIDRETPHPGGPEYVRFALDVARARLPEVRGLILSDYAKGALPPDLTPELIRLARELGLPVVVDPKGRTWRRYAGATVLTPNQKELEEVLGRPLREEAELTARGQELRERLGIGCLLVTQGARGMTLLDGQGALSLPARTPREVFDVSGAGDTVVAVLTLGLALGLPLPQAAALANTAAGVVVTKRGTAPILPGELEQELKGQGQRQEKVVSLRDLRFILAHLKAQGKRVVFTNGCFDLLHVGHVKFLEDARRLGDVLVVALDSDASVRQVKGEGRPVLDEGQRQRLLAALAAVDFVTLFDSADLPRILAELQPDVLAKGSNYPEEQVAGREVVEAYGGEVRLVPIREDISISGIIHQIRNG